MMMMMTTSAATQPHPTHRHHSAPPHTHPDYGDGDRSPYDLHPTFILDSAGTLSWQLTLTYNFYST